MSNRMKSPTRHRRMAGVTLIEMMVTMLIGSFLTLGAISIFSQSRSTYKTTDTTSRLQENARFALSQIEPDLRLAQFWGMTNKSTLIAFPAIPPAMCGPNNLGALTLPILPSIQAWNSAYPPPLAGVCNAFNNAWRANTDVLAVRHVGGPLTAPAAGTIQVQTNRTAGSIYNSGILPFGAACLATVPAPTCENHDLQLRWYYVDSQSSLGANTPSLRRKTLRTVGGAAVIDDQEIIPGVEDLQVQLGIDTNGDNTVDRYVDPNNPIVTPTTRVLAVRYWLLLRSDQAEVGFVDSTLYQYGNVPPFQRNDQFRRLLVSKTVLLRNTRV
jgi:type IV pilus assembly protein PilW